MTPDRRPRGGRPPAGPNGERTSKYPQLALRVPSAVLDRVRELAAREERPMWRVVAQAIETYAASTHASFDQRSNKTPAK
jgi:hypothetical protein